LWRIGPAYAAQVKEGVLTAGVFKANNTFESSETVYAKYYNDFLCNDWVLNVVGNKSVDIYILKDTNFTAGERINDLDIIKTVPSTLEDVCDKKKIWDPTLPTGKYDVFVDISNCEICEIIHNSICPSCSCNKLDIERYYNPILGDAYDSITNVGFEVLPELATLAAVIPQAFCQWSDT